MATRSSHPDLTYPEVGGSLREHLPDGYRHLRYRVRVGSGHETFTRYADAVLTWELHRRAGLTVATSARTAVTGADVEVGLPLGPVLVRAPNRVVAVVDEESRRGFAYGSRAGHPEAGEESFIVRLDLDGGVWLHVVGFSRPARWYARLAAPVTRAVQDVVTRRYLAVRLD
ncbi:DUF1990 family protein [Actinotalea sp. C106]|uniref:DUF1990 family protein n=1 Tax=Actinotalea sp. C106 TaxID=2908644 RepID=UPI002027E514|nr:DUF1990 domain-containing protein [Actinotalea sp. C106]